MKWTWWSRGCDDAQRSSVVWTEDTSIQDARKTTAFVLPACTHPQKRGALECLLLSWELWSSASQSMICGVTKGITSSWLSHLWIWTMGTNKVIWELNEITPVERTCPGLGSWTKSFLCHPLFFLLNDSTDAVNPRVLVASFHPLWPFLEMSALPCELHRFLRAECSWLSLSGKGACGPLGVLRGVHERRPQKGIQSRTF